jgi:predicted nuclease of restriction endonuclease-like RecB superfamily
MAEKYRNAVTEVDQLAKVIAEANSIKVPNAISVPSFNIEAMDKLKVHINEIIELKKEFLNAKKDIQLAQSELDKTSEEYNSIKPETCPLCGKPME